MSWFCSTFIYLILFANTCHGIEFLSTPMTRHTFSFGDPMFAKVNSLTSVDTEIPFSYYSLPYCKPMEGIRVSARNLGQLLLGDQFTSSPYRFRMHVNETNLLCITDPLTADKVELLKRRIRDMYQVNMFLDYLPALRYTSFDGFRIHWTGFPVGSMAPYSDDGFINNHLKFRILINEHEVNDIKIIGTGESTLGFVEKFASEFDIVGFEVIPCSVKHNVKELSELRMYENVQPINCPVDLDKSQIIQENETIAFTYDVEFVKSDTKWRSRWDSYLDIRSAKVRWFAILNSVETVFILTGIVLVIYFRSVRRELTRYEELEKEPMNIELPGWKLVVGDVFREPEYAKLLCVMVGDGIQITGTALATVLLFALGFISTLSRGMLLTSFIMLYLFFSVSSGYASVRLWNTIKGTSDGWKLISWSVASFFPGIVFIVLMFSKILLFNTKSTLFMSLSVFFVLLSLWLCISVPLTFIGGLIGSKTETIQSPVRTNHVPREIPARKSLSWMLVIGAGILPFGAIFTELFQIYSSICFGRFYLEFGFLLITLLLLIVVSAIISIIITYTRLRVEDWRWWWKAFFASGSVGIYVFLYSIYYLVSDLRGLSGPVSVALYMGYSLIMAIAVMLATGAIGFLVSFYCVYHLYSSAKIDC